MTSHIAPSAPRARKTLRGLCLLATIVAAFSFGSGARAAITFNTTFDPSVAANFGTNTAAVESAFTYAESVYSSMFADPITINITMAGSAGTGILGLSNTPLSGGFTYTQIRTALTTHSTTSNDVTAVANLPLTDPSPAAGAASYVVTRAQGKALGLVATSASSDGMTTFGAGYSYSFATDAAGRAASGKIDFVGVAEHEISEVMGRLGILGNDLGTGIARYGVLDLFGYKGAGSHSFNQTDTGVYFSLDNGTTNLKAYNPPGGGDLRDWANGTNDSYNAFSSAGVLNDVTPVDLQEMDVIGYSLVPEPGTMGLCVIMGLGVAVGARRMRRQSV